MTKATIIIFPYEKKKSTKNNLIPILCSHSTHYSQCSLQGVVVFLVFRALVYFFSIFTAHKKIHGTS